MRFIGSDPNVLDAYYKATASGSIAAGKPVVVTGPGTPTVSSEVEFESGAITECAGTFDSSNNKVVFAYADSGNSGYGTAVVATISGDAITFGSPVVFESADSQGIKATFDSSNNKVVIAYADFGNSGYGTAIVGTVSGTSISFGTATSFHNGSFVKGAITFDSSNNKVVVGYYDSGNSNYGTARVGTVSGTGISFGTEVVFNSGGTDEMSATFDSNNNKVIFTYADDAASGRGSVCSGTVSGTSISFGSQNAYENGDTLFTSATFDTATNRILVAFKDNDDSGKGKIVSMETSGTNVLVTGNLFVFNDASTDDISIAYDAAANKTGIAFNDAAESNHGRFMYATMSSSAPYNITLTDEATFNAATIDGHIGIAYDSTAERIALGFRDEGDSFKGKSVVAINDPGGKVKAIAETAISQAAGTPVEISGSFLINFGAAYDSANQKVVVVYRDVTNNSYATAAVVTVDNSDNSVSFGTPVVFNSGTTTQLGASYDTNAGKIVAVYRDFGNSQYGTAIVGTVSGTSISFGSEAVYNSATSEQNHIAYDSTAQKHVIVYQVGSDLAAIVGTVSGTSISFGSEAIVSANAAYGVPDVVYDSGNDKTVVFYADNGDSQKGKAKVGTVSGTSISFGTAAEFEGGTTLRISAAYDSSAGKVVVSYKDSGDSDKGKAAVGTVSGTGISFGTPVVFETGAIGETTTSYDVSAGKIVIAYEDDDNSDYGTVIAGAVSGTSITFETALVIENSATDEFGSVYDANAERVVIFYEDEGDSNKGKSVVFRAASTSTNVTAENYIGITDQAYTDGQDATVAVVGCIDRNQTSLTPGQQYFVQKDGTLSTTADNPSVLAGTAISATELVVKE